MKDRELHQSEGSTEHTDNSYEKSNENEEDEYSDTDEEKSSEDGFDQNEHL